MESYIEIIVGFVGIVGGILIMIWKILRVPMTIGNVLGAKGADVAVDRKDELVTEIEFLLQSESNRLLTKFGTVIKFSETVKVSNSDRFGDYLKTMLNVVRRAKTAEKKLTLDCSTIRVFNSLFVAGVASAIFDVKSNNSCKLQIVVDENSKLFDLIGQFDVLAEESTNIDIKVL